MTGLPMPLQQGRYGPLRPGPMNNYGPGYFADRRPNHFHDNFQKPRNQLTIDSYCQQPRHPSYNNQGYLPNGASGAHPNLQGAPGATPLLPNQGRVIQTGAIRVLCIADVRGKLYSLRLELFGSHVADFGDPGNLRSLNDLAKQARADHIIHTGDFGFYDDTSLERIADK